MFIFIKNTDIFLRKNSMDKFDVILICIIIFIIYLFLRLKLLNSTLLSFKVPEDFIKSIEFTWLTD
jgi:hypothetical protein